VPASTDPAFERVSYTFVARNRDALAALADAARNAGIANVSIDPTPADR
jgi:hypothetical protein